MDGAHLITQQSLIMKHHVYLIMLIRKTLCLTLVLGLFLGCGYSQMVLQAGTLAQFRTVFGDIEVELLDEEKPVTTANFKRYIREGHFQDIFFHRSAPNFVIQAGGFRVANRGATNRELVSVFTHPPIVNEYSVGTPISNVRGTIAMAKVADNPDSATSQWFFNLANNGANLDNQNGGFTVFGRMVGGSHVLDWLNTFNGGNPGGTNTIVNLGAAFTSLPLLNFPTNGDEVFANLVFVDISLLNVRVTPTAGGGRVVTWNSARQARNILEYTTVFPPIWETLISVEKPTEDESSFVDESGDTTRFYRVRTEYED